MDGSLHFNRFELQPRQRRLLADGQPVPLGSRAFDLLTELARRAGSLVTKAELLDTVWPGLVVEEANITTQISGLRKTLGEGVIATIPGRGYRFVAELRSVSGPVEAAPAPPSPPPPPAAAPAGPRLVGRDDDLARVEALLQSPGCITLVGPAGVGKTRLAQALLARRTLAAQPVVWVDLAALADAAQLPGALARAVGRPLAEGDLATAVAAALADAPHTLLVLDNAEHVIDAIAAFAAALGLQAPALRVLVTSQQPLHVADERIARLQPLAMPADDATGDDTGDDGALALLIDRIGAADHRFRVTPAALPLLREICHRLDGLPLALEMAAARVPVLGLKGVRDALERRFALLTTGHRGAPGRHRTLQAALEWSHGLLGADEQRLLRWLGVFAGGFTLELAVALLCANAGDDTADRWAVIDSLATLVDRSLVSVDAHDPPRYRLLDSVRAFTAVQRSAAGDDRAARQHHAAALFALAAFALQEPPDESQLALARAEHDNMREALAWATEAGDITALPAARAVCRVAQYTPWRTEAQSWLERLEPMAHDPAVDPRERVRWWLAGSLQRTIGGDHAAAAVMAARGRALAQAIGDEELDIYALCSLLRATKDPVAVRPLQAELQARMDTGIERPLPLRRAAAASTCYALDTLYDLHGLLRARELEFELSKGDRAEMIDAREMNVFHALMNVGRSAEVPARSRAMMARIADTDSANVAYGWQAHLRALLDTGGLAEARACMPAALAAARRFRLQLSTEWLARLLSLEGHPEAAARATGYVRRAYAPHGCGSDVDRILDAGVTLAEETLGQAAVAQLLQEGSAMDDAAFDRLLADTAPRSA